MLRTKCLQYSICDAMTPSDTLLAPYSPPPVLQLKLLYLGLSSTARGCVRYLCDIGMLYKIFIFMDGWGMCLIYIRENER